MSKGNFGKICSITNEFIKEGNRCFGYFLGFSWLWGHFEGLKFGVQGTTFGIYGGENTFSIFGEKTKCVVSSFGGSKLVYLKCLSTNRQLKFGKKLQPL